PAEVAPVPGSEPAAVAGPEAIPDDGPEGKLPLDDSPRRGRLLARRQLHQLRPLREAQRDRDRGAPRRRAVRRRRDPADPRDGPALQGTHSHLRRSAAPGPGADGPVRKEGERMFRHREWLAGVAAALVLAAGCGKKNDSIKQAEEQDAASGVPAP